MKIYLVHAYTTLEGGCATVVRNNDYFVFDENDMALTYDDLMHAADDTRFSVADAIEALTQEEEYDYPTFDQAEAAGFDGTLRDRNGELITWKELALKLLADKGVQNP